MIKKKYDEVSNQNSERSEQHVINQRYIERLQNILKKYNFDFNIESDQNNKQELTERIVEIKESEDTKLQKNKFYFILLKNMYGMRKILNPELTFQGFLAKYNSELNQKFKRFKINEKIQIVGPSKILNQLLLKNELEILKYQTMEMIKQKSDLMVNIKEQSENINFQYQQMVKQLIQKPLKLNIENLELQLKLKQLQKQQKQSLDKIFSQVPQKKFKQQQKSGKIKYKKSQQASNPKKEQVQRIKTVIKNNMWGYGQQIKQKLKKLQTLREQSLN